MQAVRFNLASIAIVSVASLAGELALADQVFVRPTLFSGTNPQLSDSVDQYVKEALTSEGKHIVTPDARQADYVIESLLVQYEDRIELTVHKKRGNELLYTRTLNLALHAPIDANTKWLVRTAVETKPYSERYSVGTLLSTGTTPPSKRAKSKAHYYFSYGPAVSDGLENEQVMANINVGGSWMSDMNLIKIYYSHTGGTNEEKDTKMSGLGFSAGRILTHSENPAFVNADLVWGETSYHTATAAAVGQPAAQSTKTKSGFIYGLGAGVIFLRNSSVSMESGVQVNSFMGRTSSGVPSTLGFRVGVHF